ncbi:bifunctional UDP-N-acetylglucosamine diphosphorylase/glucosamine-1-phosphate N-acetyltransferase GlmU [Dermatobacter hominis]|uniref:bifunctional UDP-N-acetylglucosamine diphosphorylase/glucosamine-1-phosphate N-acetyltransferase GlmU n=1 Tax=Dermatobacter hominis TaxID=2884263 RepID=UPI001D0FDDAE|nr:NTP transferase domain-containing protein [Dermatobacter hominis]UDY37701.1 NTP transferase domain-containing protein [Dermatobacter hominis]
MTDPFALDDDPTDVALPPLAAVVLAAGEGRRMQSERPKPLHRLCGRPMLMYVLDSLASTDASRAVIVVGHKGDWVAKKLLEHSHRIDIEFVEQRVQRGTGDAAMVGLVGLPDEEDEGDVLVLPGDAPLLRPATIAELVGHHRSTGAAATVLTAVMDDPSGYGRVVRGSNGSVERIVEDGDASAEEREIDEINTSIYCFRRSLLAPALRRVEPDNAQGEYYLTDVVAVLSGTGHRVEAVIAHDPAETQGVNDRVQLAAAESELRRRTNESLLRSGVTMLDPASVFVDTTVEVGQDVTLFPGVILQGATVVGDGTELGPNTRLVDCTVGDDCVIEQTTARSARIGDRCTVGPYASFGAGSELPSDVTTGPFYTADTAT